VDEGEVTATAIHDDCAGRRLVMTAHPWQQVQLTAARRKIWFPPELSL
jgi:hypothetical protein